MLMLFFLFFFALGIRILRFIFLYFPSITGAFLWLAYGGPPTVGCLNYN